MKRTVFWGLLALNVILLAALLAPYMKGNDALAQPRGGAGGRRPELLMIPGEVTGQASHVVYLVDTANRRLGAIALNQRGNGLDSLAPQDLDRIFEDRGGAVRGGAKDNKKP
jgi:hypothetical protein